MNKYKRYTKRESQICCACVREFHQWYRPVVASMSQRGCKGSLDDPVVRLKEEKKYSKKEKY